MDENYLDDLLKGVSTDNQKKNNSFDKTVEKDSGIDIDYSDLDDISLEEFDTLDGLDLEELDFDDIDFDDLDVTNLENSNKITSAEFIPEKEEFNADDMLEESVFEEELPEPVKETEEITESKENNSDDSISASDIDSLFAGLEESNQDEVAEQAAGMENFDSMFSDNSSEDSFEGVESMDLDDLFSALGIDETEGVKKDDYLSGQDDLDQLLQATMESSFQDGDLADLEDIGEKPTTKSKKGRSKDKNKVKEKKTISEILFGAPDEDDAEEERLFELKKLEKEQKKAAKQEASELKKAAKQEKLSLKQEEDAKKKSEKDEKKRIKEAELLAEYEAEKGTKQLPTIVVVLVFLAFAALLVVVVFGAKSFNYANVIEKASGYFDKQRYRLAYDEVSGVEVKEEDEELRDRIYTVMYVERLYESYENNMTLGRPDKALDSLLRGLEKYDEHYEDALALGIATDIKSVKEKIINALWNTYGLTESQSYELMSLDGAEYIDALINECDGLMPTGE